ncbi:MAG: hypothetical protein GVY36_12610 [Verrucomicrobia bacterium]|jgi:cytochrome b|nr:hypothetical protein [Verrucomicrobiota bacterium]
MENKSPKELVWDWSIRVFHWMFAGSVSMALAIGLLVDDHSPLFEWHMLAGLTAGFLLLLRLLLFAVSSPSTSWRGLLGSLRGTPAFVRGLFSKQTSKLHATHNPLAWVVYLLMFGLLGGSVATGINMQIDWAEDVHEFLAWGMLSMIAAHMLGLAVHTFRQRENIAGSMIHGRKRVATGTGIKSSRPILGLLIVATAAAFVFQLLGNYKKGAGQMQLPWLPVTVMLDEDGAEYGDGFSEGAPWKTSDAHKEDDEHD